MRIKPLGAGGGGGEASAAEAVEPGVKDVDGAVLVTSGSTGGRQRLYQYPSHIASSDNATLYDRYMPSRLQAFLDGFNVTVMCYGQTGSGKTHTMFGEWVEGREKPWKPRNPDSHSRPSRHHGQRCSRCF